MKRFSGLAAAVDVAICSTGSTKADVARVLGLTPRALAYKLAGEFGFTWLEAVKLRRQFGVSLDRFADMEAPE